ncbi:FAD-dependent oxidoreductase [Nocardia sp. NBC_01503]|uniref:NAD(P)/FAD-dependent oxidoreductase n=1 Tax=Nocardia sp. NBC_01503 TaxID=2975997 RepID=UPI002E7AF913|nr:FAD-dependent oxidoreductase [Nocardia sp. NBC_01503]WTL31877.1 FAD-dependent oxidoreductase [Nocardia sp. NBC_01503]
MTERIVIIGGGVAGATAAKTLRSSGYDGEIVLLSAERSLPYRRPMVSKELLAGTAVERRTLLEPAEFWPERGIELRTGVTVESIDADRAVVRMLYGGEIGYDALLLATGARPRALPGVRHGLPMLRGRDDIEVLRRAIDEGSLLIAGAGLIGCEVAATAANLGARVTVLHAGTTPLDRIAPPVIGDYVRKLHADNGVDIHGDVLLTGVEQLGNSVRASATDGREWRAGAALIAIGAVADTALAETAGVKVDDGILVDEAYRTSVPGIFAAGDAAARFDPGLNAYVREEHWNSAQAQGAAAAQSMLGLPPTPVGVSWGWSTQYGINIQFAGRILPGDDLEVRGTPGTPDITVLASRDGCLRGAVSIGRPADIRAVRAELSARS